MRNPKTVADLTQKQIVDLWMREYEFCFENETPRDTADEWRLVVDGKDVYTGDYGWTEDFLYEDGNYLLSGTFGDVKKRIDTEPRLNNAINKAEAEMNEEIREFEERRKQEKEKWDAADKLQSLKNNPWISVETMPDFPFDNLFKQYLATDGKLVRFVQMSRAFDEEGNLYFYVPGFDTKRSKEFCDKITHWMPVERLLIYLPEAK